MLYIMEGVRNMQMEGAREYNVTCMNAWRCVECVRLYNENVMDVVYANPAGIYANVNYKNTRQINSCVKAG